MMMMIQREKGVRLADSHGFVTAAEARGSGSTATGEAGARRALTDGGGGEESGLRSGARPRGFAFTLFVGALLAFTAGVAVAQTTSAVRVDGIEEGGKYPPPVTPEVVVRGNYTVEAKKLNGEPYEGSGIVEQGLHELEVTVSDQEGRLYSSTTRFFVLDPEERAPTYTVDMVSHHVGRLADYPHVMPTLTANRELVVGTSSGWPEDPEIPEHDLYGFRITDPEAEEPKLRLVLVSGNHPREQTGSWALQGALDFLVSDDPRAEDLRGWATFFVYPMVNPDGRFLASGRSNPEMLEEDVSDHNRVWNTSGRFTTTDIFVEAITTDTGGTADYLLDFHSAGSTFFYTGADLMDSAYARTMTAREPDVRPRLSSGHPGMTRLWAMSEEGLNAPFAFTPELAGSETAKRSMEIGRSYMLAFHDMITGESALAALAEALTAEGGEFAFGRLYRERLPGRKEAMEAVLEQESDRVDRILAAVYEAYEDMSEYREALGLSESAGDSIAAARELLEESRLVLATWIEEELTRRVDRLEQAVLDPGSMIDEVRKLNEALAGGLEDLRDAEMAETALAVADEGFQGRDVGFGEVYRKSVLQTRNSLEALLRESGMSREAIRGEAERLDDRVARYWRVRSESPSPAVAPVRITGVPEVIEVSGARGWEDGLLVNVEVEEDGLVPGNGVAMHFDGEDSHVVTGFHPGESSLGQEFTWEFWKRYSSFEDDTGSSGSRDTEPRFYTQLTGSDGQFRTAIGDSYWNSVTLDEEDRWYHIAVVFEKGEVRTYVDGELRDTRSDVEFSGDSPSPFAIGRGYDGERWLDGYSREHRVWNTARSQGELRRNRFRGLDGDEDHLVGYWKLSEGEGDRARDYSGNEYHGTVEGATWSGRALPGYRISQPVLFTETANVNQVVVSWETGSGNGNGNGDASVTVLAGLSESDTVLPDQWHPSTNGEALEIFEERNHPAGTHLWVKQKLSPGTSEVPTRLHHLTLRFD